MIAVKDKTIKVAINIGIYALIFVLLHIFLGRGILQGLRKEQISLRAAQAQLDEKEKLIKTYPKPEQNLEEIKEKMAVLQSKSASDKELPRIIQQLTQKTSELGIEIGAIKPIQELPFSVSPPPPGIAKSYIQVVLKAPYKTIGTYLQALDQLTTVYTIESFELAKPPVTSEDATRKKKEEEGRIQATLILSSYQITKI